MVQTGAQEARQVGLKRPLILWHIGFINQILPSAWYSVETLMRMALIPLTESGFPQIPFLALRMNR